MRYNQREEPNKAETPALKFKEMIEGRLEVSCDMYISTELSIQLNMCMQIWITCLNPIGSGTNLR